MGARSDNRMEMYTKGFQSGWLKSPDGTQGPRWYLVKCGYDCACGPDCLNCPASLAAKKEKRKVQHSEQDLLEPLKWKTWKTVFVCPEGDLFHKNVPVSFIARVFAVMETCPDHRFVVVTKRAERMKKVVADPSFLWRVHEAGEALLGDQYLDRGRQWGDNILIGVSVGTQDSIHKSLVLPELPASMTKVLFAAPMITPIDVPEPALKVLGWVVCNGERGAWCNPRPCKLEWQRDLADQCSEYDIPYFLLRQNDPVWIKKMRGRKFLEFPPVLRIA